MKIKTCLCHLFLFFAFACCTIIADAQTVTFKPVAKFTYPGALGTLASGINEAGNVVGAFLVSQAGYGNGFERYADGTFSAPIVYPGSTVYQTIPTSINNNETIAGWYNTEPGYTHGFFLSQGVFTSFDYPGANYTTIAGMNDAGDFVGNYALADSVQHAYASIGGELMEITIPDATYVEVHGINNYGEIVGWYNTPTNSLGFRLRADGTGRYPIKVPGSLATVLFGLNDGRECVGAVPNYELTAGLYLVGNRAYFTYNFPGLTYDQLNGINSRGVICGYGYNAARGVTYSYIVRRESGESAQ